MTGGVSDNTLDASGFSGAVTLTGGSGNDTLTGADGNDSLDGGVGTDQLLHTSNEATQSLTDAQLVGEGTDVVANIETAILTGGAGDNNIDATGFTGSVTVTGGAGDDTLAGGAGTDSIDGGDGTDKLVQLSLIHI